MAAKKGIDPKSEISLNRLEPIKLQTPPTRGLAYKSLSFGTAALKVGETIKDKSGQKQRSGTGKRGR